MIIGAISYAIFSILFSFSYSLVTWSDEEYLFFDSLKKMIPLFLLIVLVASLFKGDFSLFTNSVQDYKQLVIVWFILFVSIKVIGYFITHWVSHEKYDSYTNTSEGISFTEPFIIILVFITVITLSLFSWQFLFVSLTNSSYIQGSIDNDMKNKYHMNDSPIHTLIQITGPDTEISVRFKSESNNQNYDAVIYLDKNNESMLNKSLNGKRLGKGEYSVYINTTGMSIGYYELRTTRQKYPESYNLRRFYLEND